MLELPEAYTLARQMKEELFGKTVVHVVAGAQPHGFAFYEGDASAYGDMLAGRKVTGAVQYGGRAELWLGDMRLSVNDGVNTRLLAPDDKRPQKHQLLLEFDDGRAIVCTIQMYGGIAVFLDGTKNDFYYTAAREKPSPLSDGFDEKHFEKLLSGAQKLSAKAFLATEQRIPGLGNGVLQDILWRSKIHPKTKMGALSSGETDTMFSTVKAVLREMTDAGGRDTEKDLYGDCGGYQTVLSRNTVGLPCTECGTVIRRMAYLGGNVYVCDGCQSRR